MSNLNYPNKPVSGDGGSSYVEGKSVPANELQGDFDAVAGVLNGNIDNNNINGSAGIAISKLAAIGANDVGDHSSDAATASITSTMGDSDTIGSNLPSDLTDEIEGLRYNIAGLKHLNGTVQYADSAGTLQNVSWVETPVAGPNLLCNPGMEDEGLASGDPPTGWSEVGTLTASSMADAPNDTGTHTRAFQMLCDTSEGIAQSVQGLKESTKYVFGFKYFLTSGGVSFSTAGGLASGNAYQDPSFTTTTTGAAAVTAQLIVQSDSSGSDITVRALASQGSTVVNIVDTWFCELRDDQRADVPCGYTQTATHSGNEVLPSTTTNNTWVYEDVNELDMSVYVPGPGYRVVYEANVSHQMDPRSGAAGTCRGALRLLLDTGGGDAVVDGPYTLEHSAASVNDLSMSGTSMLRYVLDDAVPGTTYAFSVSVGGYDNDPDDRFLIISPQANGLQSVSRAWLRLERK